MKASDLRVGNVLEYYIEDEMDERKAWWEPTIIDAEDILHCSKNEKQFNDYHRPIPLNEGILLKKLGFTLHEVAYNIISKDNLMIHFRGGKPFLVWVNYGHTHLYCEQIKELNYLHELQNVFYVLNSKELNINGYKA